MRFCSLASGSSGNCQYIETPEYRILIDIGLSGKQIEQAMTQCNLDPASVDAVFVTHEHVDHIRGVGIWARRYRVPVLATAGTWKGMENSLGRIPGELRREIQIGRGYRLGKLRVVAVPTCHDANEPCGYVAEYEGQKVMILTDTGLVTEEARKQLYEADLAVVESNYDVEMLMQGSYPMPLKRRILSNLGHLSNEACGALLADLYQNHCHGTYLLGHLSHENNRPEVAMETVQRMIRQKIGSSGEKVYLTHREKPTDVYEL